MTAKPTELSKRLVVGHKRDGRSCYDKEAKRELIEACLQPGVSVARMGLQHGINANLLRTWITRYRRQRALTVGRPASEMSTTAPGRSTTTPAKTRSVPLSSEGETGCSPIPSAAPTPAPTSTRSSRPVRPTPSIRIGIWWPCSGRYHGQPRRTITKPCCRGG